MRSYKAYLTRSMAAASKVAPFIFDQVLSALQTSAAAAALQCSGSPSEYPNGRMCGLSWSKKSAWDGTYGVGQQMAALEVIQSNLIAQSKAPLTNTTGGTSVGDPSAGISDPSASNLVLTEKVTTAGRAGAGIITAIVVCVVIGGLGWLSLPDGNAR
jgi:mannan endo-1,6-alpha-mannosidase